MDRAVSPSPAMERLLEGRSPPMHHGKNEESVFARVFLCRQGGPRGALDLNLEEAGKFQPTPQFQVKGYP